MDWKLLRGTGRPGPLRVPNNYFGDYFSPGFSECERAPVDQWVTGKFCSSLEHRLFIGSESGFVCVINVDAPPGPDQSYEHYFRAHQGAVMDIISVPGKEEELLTMSGGDIRIWTLAAPGDPVKSSLFIGHEKSVRAAAFAPNDSNLFATGGRDGCILMWDRRVARRPQNDGSAFRRPVKEYKNCHQIRPQPVNPAVGGGRRRSGHGMPLRAPPSITSMTYLDEHLILTASESGKSGIRLWDTRKHAREGSQPVAVMEIPSNTARDFGVSSICLDRFRSSLFAVSTDNCIHEYRPNTPNLEPVRSYVGACIDADFYIQMACSPISDHIMCGSGDQRALVWDTQKFHAYADQRLTGPASIAQKGIRPSLALGGHNKKVSTVGYSANGMYMLSMDESKFRVWRHMPVSRSSLQDAEENLGMAFERVERLAAPQEDVTSTVLERFSITPGPRLFLSPTKAGMAPLQKRKEPFSSSSSATRLFFNEKENIPPGMKATKWDDVSLPPLEEAPEELRRREEEAKGRKGNPFYFKHPTMFLPNLVLERHEEKKRRRERGEEAKEEEEEKEIVTKSGRKVRRTTTLDSWATPTTPRRGKHCLSPIGECPEPAFAAAAAAAAAAVPQPSPSPRKLQLLRPALQQTNEGAPVVNGRRSSSRNILDYFATNKKK